MSKKETKIRSSTYIIHLQMPRKIRRTGRYTGIPRISDGSPQTAFIIGHPTSVTKAGSAREKNHNTYIIYYI